MGKEQFKEHLMKFDLTRREATQSMRVFWNGKLTGYEAAKLTGISRSNVYVALASLCEKGAAYLEASENGKRYLSVPVQEFCEDKIDQLKKEEDWLVMHAPVRKEEEEGYITISGQETIEASKSSSETGKERCICLLDRLFWRQFCRSLPSLPEMEKRSSLLRTGKRMSPTGEILLHRTERTDGNDWNSSFILSGI